MYLRPRPLGTPRSGKRDNVGLDDGLDQTREAHQSSSSVSFCGQSPVSQNTRCARDTSGALVFARGRRRQGLRKQQCCARGSSELLDLSERRAVCLTVFSKGDMDGPTAVSLSPLKNTSDIVRLQLAVVGQRHKQHGTGGQPHGGGAPGRRPRKGCPARRRSGSGRPASCRVATRRASLTRASC